MADGEKKDANSKVTPLGLKTKLNTPTIIVEKAIEYYKQNKMLLAELITLILLISWIGSYLSGIGSFLYSFIIGSILAIWFPAWKEKIIKSQIEKTGG
jgi:hypothetical protein